MFFYVFKMAVAIAFLCKNAVEAIQIYFISVHPYYGNTGC